MASNQENPSSLFAPTNPSELFEGLDTTDEAELKQPWELISGKQDERGEQDLLSSKFPKAKNLETILGEVKDPWEVVDSLIEDSKPEPIVGEKGEKGEDGKDGRDGKDAKDGVDGKSVSPEEVAATLLSSEGFIQAVKGEDGKDGTSGKNGKDGSVTVKEPDEDLIQKSVSKVVKNNPDLKRAVERSGKMLASLGIGTQAFNNLVNRVDALENNPSGGLRYLSLNTSGTTTYTTDDFIFGRNIIGVNATGAVVIRLPDNLTTGTLVTVNDESLDATTNNITIETYKV